jgi:hypothetical protein
MVERMEPVFRRVEKVSLVGTMAIYESQAEASRLIPQQWQEFRRAHAGLESGARLVGASPCTGDGKIHYMVGVELEGSGGVGIGGERLVLGRESMPWCRWTIQLRFAIRGGGYLGRGCRGRDGGRGNSGISDEGLPVGMVEIWVPLEVID